MVFEVHDKSSKCSRVFSERMRVSMAEFLASKSSINTASRCCQVASPPYDTVNNQHPARRPWLDSLNSPLGGFLRACDEGQLNSTTSFGRFMQARTGGAPRVEHSSVQPHLITLSPNTRQFVDL